MKKSVNCFFYFSHLFKMSTINKIRMILTSIGIFVAVFLFSTSNIIIISYYNESFNSINQFKDNTAIINTTISTEELNNNLSFAQNYKRTDVSTLAQNKSMLSVNVSGEQYLNIVAISHGVSSINNMCPIVIDNGLLIPVQSKLIKGRSISLKDIQLENKVVVIDEFTEKLLFNTSDGIGKYISLDVGYNGGTTVSSNPNDMQQKNLKYEVIGIVENSYQTELTQLTLKQELISNTENITKNLSIYFPISTLNSVYKESDKNKSYLYSFENDEDYNSFVSKTETLLEIKNFQDINFTITTKEMLLNNLELELSNSKTLINLILIVLCIITGISIMSITFFSLKERIPEIGIRKAFGASKIDIGFQFVFEMIIISIIASVLAVIISIGVSIAVENYLTQTLFIPFSVILSIDILILPILIGVLQAVLCSIIPSVYASKIKVTECLKFE